MPDAFAADPDRLARFTREAQVLASLNHPNIAAIYGVEERAIVMELVEGRTLAGPMTLHQQSGRSGSPAAATKVQRVVGKSAGPDVMGMVWLLIVSQGSESSD